MSARLELPLDKVAPHLEDMAFRGLLFRLEKKGSVKYGAIPFVHGLFEFQVKTLSKDLALMVEQYEKEGFERAMLDSGGYFLRTIPIQRAVDTTQHIAAYEDALALLREKDLIVVTDCICRKKSETVDHSCGKPLEACFMFGSMGQYYLDRDMGRKIDLEEAIAILTKCPGGRSGDPTGHLPESVRHVQLLRGLLRGPSGAQQAPQAGRNRFFQLSGVGGRSRVPGVLHLPGPLPR